MGNNGKITYIANSRYNIFKIKCNPWPLLKEIDRLLSLENYNTWY